MKELEKLLWKHLKDRGWDNLKPSDLAKSILIEGAELLENFQWDNPTLQDTKKDKKRLKEVKNELADVMTYSIEMSILLGFDTKKIIKDKLAIVQKKYPAKLMKKHNGEPGTEAAYRDIKNKYRKQK